MTENTNREGDAETVLSRKNTDGKLSWKQKLRRHLPFGSSREDDENSKLTQGQNESSVPMECDTAEGKGGRVIPSGAGKDLAEGQGSSPSPQDCRTPVTMKSECTSWSGDSGTLTSRKHKAREFALNQRRKRVLPFGSSRENGQNAGDTTTKQGCIEGCTPLEYDSASEEKEQSHPRGLFDTETQDRGSPVTMKSRCLNSRREAGILTLRKCSAPQDCRTPVTMKSECTSWSGDSGILTSRKHRGWKRALKRKQKLKGPLPLDSSGKNDQTSGAPISADVYIEGCFPMEYDSTEEERAQRYPGGSGVGDSVQSHGTGLDPKTNILELLSHCDNYQQFQLSNFYGERLKPAIEERIEEFCLILREKGHLNGQEHEAVADLAKKGDRAESSKLLFGLLMRKGAQTRRVMWESFVKMQKQLPKLDKILKEILEHGPDPSEYMDIGSPQDLSVPLKDVQQKHKETLRIQTETLRENANLMREKVKVSQLVDRYTELTVISTVRLRRLVEQELRATGRKHEELRKKQLQRELEIIQTDQLFQSSFSRGKSKTGSSATVVGITGIGKTTMVQKIVHDWATGKIYPQFQFVFIFKFWDLNSVNCRINLRELILNQYPYFGNLLKEVWNNPEGLMFIFDGLDEFKHRIDFTDSQKFAEPKHWCPDPEWWCEVSDIVYSLIQHKLLPGCSVLVTTRPTALHLLKKADISVSAEILGFVGEERKGYFYRFFEDQTVAAAVFKHLEENEILYTMSYNPSYCRTLAQALDPFFTNKDRGPQRVPKTITQLYSYYILNILKNHSREIESPCDVLIRVGQMAFTGVSQRKVVFTETDLSNYKLQPSKFLSGFLMELLEREDSVYTFPHLTVQEFVAALALLIADGKGILKLLTEAQSTTDERFEIFLRFVAGLSSPGSARDLEEFLGPFPNDTTCQVIDWVKEEFKRQLENSWSKRGKRSLLNTLHCLFESQNRELAQATLGSVETLSFSGLQLTLIDCMVLSHVLEFCDAIKVLKLTGCQIQSEGLQRLRSRLHKCQDLGMADNSLGDSVMHLVSTLLRTPDCIVQRLELASNHLTDSGAKEIASALIANRSLTVLNLSNNKLGDSGVKLVSSALRDPDCKIQALELGCVGLTDSGAEDLVSALSTSRSLAELDLRSNSLSDRSVPCLCHLILTLLSLKRIWLSDNCFSSDGERQLKQEPRPGLTVEL